jgi:outer membrane protein
MKQFKFIIAVFAIVLASSLSANAQKIGYINIDGLVGLFPEIPAIQAKIDQFSKDSVGGEYERLMAEFNRQDSIVKNSKTKSLADVAQKNRDDIGNILGQWQQYGSNKLQAKQAELLQPLYKKIMDATLAVSKEKGYAYVLDTQVFIVAPSGDDLTPVVAAKLNLKMPPNYKPGINNAE